MENGFKSPIPDRSQKLTLAIEIKLLPKKGPIEYK